MADPVPGERAVRSALFVPANRRSWIEKVHEYGADAVVLDLEDATPPGHKAQARTIVGDLLELLARQGQGVWIRVNALDSGHLHDDLDASCRAGVDLLVLPKVSGPGDVAELDRLIGYHEGRNGLAHGTIGICPLLETARGIVDAGAVFAASPRVRYGGAVTGANADVQFAVGYRWTPSFTETLHLRSSVLLAARAHGIENPVTGLVTGLDADLARRFAEQSRDIGYAGMFVIHPSHVAPANEAFAPTDAERAWSREILDGYARDLDTDRGAVLDSEGRLVDYAMIRVAEQIAARHEHFVARDRARVRT